MNKILVSDIINLDSGSYDLDIQNKEIKITINGIVTIYLLNQVTNKINIDLLDNSKLNIYKYNRDKDYDLEVNISQNNNSTLNYNEAYLNNNDNKLIINNNINGNNNRSNINIRNISNNNESNIIINVNIKKNTINNIALEDLKGITNGGFIHIEPNIICESNEVEANHLTTIGNIDESLLNYLMSKNISRDNAKKLILKGLIYSNMDELIKNKVEVNNE